MSTNEALSLDTLITNELNDKATAIFAYDKIIWKIRSGYILLIYGSIGIVVGLVNQKAIKSDIHVLMSIIVLVLGFSVFCAFLDYSFVVSKLRVVKYRDKLVRLAFMKVLNRDIGQRDNELLECLKNSGERNEHFSWKGKIGRSVVATYYLGTGLVCIVATILLMA